MAKSLAASNCTFSDRHRTGSYQQNAEVTSQHVTMLVSTQDLGICRDEVSITLFDRLFAGLGGGRLLTSTSKRSGFLGGLNAECLGFPGGKLGRGAAQTRRVTCGPDQRLSAASPKVPSADAFIRSLHLRSTNHNGNVHAKRVKCEKKGENTIFSPAKTRSVEK